MTKIRHRKSRWQDPTLPGGSVKQIQHKFYPLYAFGFEGISGKRGQIACLDSNLIVYSIAGNVVFHNVSVDKSMRFFSSSGIVEAIVWLTSSPAGNFVAACERLKTGCYQVTIIDVKKLEAIQTIGGLTSGEYGACAFSENERLVIFANNLEESSQVEYWDIKDGRVLMTSVVPYTINKITINPLDDEESAMSGHLHFKFWSVKGGGAKKETSIQGFQGRHDPTMTLTDHVWLADSSVAISTVEGIIFIVRENAVQHKYMDTGHTICLYSTGRELFCGRSDGTLTQYSGFEMAKVKMQEKESPYAEVKCVTLLSGYSQISSIAMPPHGQKLLYLVEGETVLKVHLDIDDDDDVVLGSEPNLARPVQLSVFTMKKITGMDVCEQRMILVTCSSDNMIRVWNYNKMVCEITHLCDEEPQLITVSPWGHYLFVSMARCIQIYRILGYRLYHCKDISGMKNIKHLKYSPSGHLVAAANAREIVLIDAFTWKVSSILKGHTGVVTTLAWSSDSIYLASAGADGAIYAWFLDGAHRYLEYVIKGSIHTCLLFDPERTHIIACGPKLPIKVIDTDKKFGLSHGKEVKLLPEELAGPIAPDFEALAQMYAQSARESDDGSTPGDIQGSALESHRGSIQESIRGSIQGRNSIAGSQRGSIQAPSRGSVQQSHKGSVILQGARRTSARGSTRGSIQGSRKGTDVEESGEISHRGSIVGSQKGGDVPRSGEESHRGSIQGSFKGEVQKDNQETISQGESIQGVLGGGVVQEDNQENHRGSYVGSHRGSNLGIIGTSLPGEKLSHKERRERRKSLDSGLEGSWVQHRFRSNCIIELTHDKSVNFIVGLFKKGVLVTATQEGDLRIYLYPFSVDKTNLVKEVSLFPSGEISGLCLDEDRKLIFTSSTSGVIFVGTVAQDIVPPKEESPDDFETEITIPEETYGRPMPLISHYLTDTCSDSHNILLERDEVDEMKRDLVEFKLKMAMEAKDASFKHQRDALDWACEMKERETAFLAREKDYNVKIKVLEHNLHTALSEKETTIQSLLNAHSQTTQQLQDYFQDKLAQELERSHISRKQAQKDRVTLEKGMRSKENIYLEKMVTLERQLEEADIRAEERVAKVREECKIEIEHMKLELEEDLLISDDELNKAFAKLNHDVGVEKERVESVYNSWMAEKRTVMHIEKQMKEMEEEHHLHLDTIAKLKKEVAELKKLATELDFEKRTLRQVLIETEEKSQHLVSERKDQETKTVVRDFKIEQMKKIEGPLKEATVDLRNKLREMESHQLGYVLEMKRQGLAMGALRAKIQNLEDEAVELNDQLHEKDVYIQMFTQALCRLVQDNDVAEWPNLIKQLYFTYVKEIHRTAVSEGTETYSHLLHQRESLERFVSILKREIARSEARNWNDARHYMQQNVELLHEFGEAQRNVRRLAFISQKYQGEMAYWKTIATKKSTAAYTTGATGRVSLEQPFVDQRSGPKATPLARRRPSSSVVTTRAEPPTITRRPTTTTARESTTTSAAIKPAKVESESPDAERVREQSRSDTPIPGIVKPYEHKGSVPQAATLRYSFTTQQHQSPRPWSTDPTADVDHMQAKMLALSIEVIELKKQIAIKDKVILRLTRDQHHVTGAYLPRARSASILANIPADEVTAKLTSEGKPRPSTGPPETVAAVPQWNEISSVESPAHITTPKSAKGSTEARRKSATELLAERRASYVHAAAVQKRRTQSMTMTPAAGERRASRDHGEVEVLGAGERRSRATAPLAERRASKLAVEATAAELSPRRGSGSTRRSSSCGSTPRTENAHRKVSSNSSSTTQQTTIERPRDSKSEAEQTRRRSNASVHTTAPQVPEREPNSETDIASRKTSTSLNVSVSSLVPERGGDFDDTAVAPMGSENVQGASMVTSSAETEDILATGKRSSLTDSAVVVSTPVATTEENSAAVVVEDPDAADTDVASTSPVDPVVNHDQ